MKIQVQNPIGYRDLESIDKTILFIHMYKDNDLTNTKAIDVCDIQDILYGLENIRAEILYHLK